MKDSKTILMQGQHLVLAQIVRVESIVNYSRIFSIGRYPIIISKALKEVELILQPFGFLRVHRSHLVNKDYIKAVEDTFITMEDKSVIAISRRKKKQVMMDLTQNDSIVEMHNAEFKKTGLSFEFA